MENQMSADEKSRLAEIIRGHFARLPLTWQMAR